jgi:hypothetical protein
MKTQIEKLIVLAKEYEVFGRKVCQSGVWNCARGSFGVNLKGVPNSKEGEISIYFADDYSVCSIKFGKIEVQLYRSCIEIPFNVTEELLQETFDDCKKYLDDYLIPNREKMILDEEGIKLSRIAELENEIRRIKSGEIINRL